MKINNRQGQKKADGKTDGFLIEISIDKNSLPQSSDLYVPAGLLSCMFMGAKVEALKQVISTPTLRGCANERNISESIAIFEEKIRHWHKKPIEGEFNFWMFVLSHLPHKTSRNNSFYVVEESGKFKIRFSGHNALAKYLNHNEKYKIGITFQSKDMPITFEPQKNIYYKEHVYYSEYLSSEVLCDILKGIVAVLKGGYYNVPCDKELYSPTKKKYDENFNGSRTAKLDGLAKASLPSSRFMKRYAALHHKQFTLQCKQKVLRLLSSLQRTIAARKLCSADPNAAYIALMQKNLLALAKRRAQGQLIEIVNVEKWRR